MPCPLSCHHIGAFPTPHPPVSRPQTGPGSTLGTTWAPVTGEQQAQGRARTGPRGFGLVGLPTASLRRWCLSGRGQWEPREGEGGGWVFSGSSSPTPSAFQEGSRKLCWQGPSSSPLPGTEGGAGGGGQAVQAGIPSSLYPPMLDSASWDQASSTVGPLPSLLQRSRGGEGKALWTLPGLGRVAESSLLELGVPGCVGKKPEALGAGWVIQLLSWLKAPWRSCQDGGRGLQRSHPYGLGRIPPLFPPCFPGQPCHLRP